MGEGLSVWWLGWGVEGVASLSPFQCLGKQERGNMIIQQGIVSSTPGADKWKKEGLFTENKLTSAARKQLDRKLEYYTQCSLFHSATTSLFSLIASLYVCLLRVLTSHHRRLQMASLGEGADSSRGKVFIPTMCLINGPITKCLGRSHLTLCWGEAMDAHLLHSCR